MLVAYSHGAMVTQLARSYPGHCPFAVIRLDPANRFETRMLEQGRRPRMFSRILTCPRKKWTFVIPEQESQVADVRVHKIGPGFPSISVALHCVGPSRRSNFSGLQAESGELDLLRGVWAPEVAHALPHGTDLKRKTIFQKISPQVSRQWEVE